MTVIFEKMTASQLMTQSISTELSIDNNQCLAERM